MEISERHSHLLTKAVVSWMLLNNAAPRHRQSSSDADDLDAILEQLAPDPAMLAVYVGQAAGLVSDTIAAKRE